MDQRKSVILRQLTTTFPVFLRDNCYSNNANPKHYFKVIRMLYSLYGIKISQKNTLEKIFILVDAKRLLSYIILSHYIQTAGIDRILQS